MRKLLYILIILLVVLFGGLALGGGPLIKWYINSHGPALTHRQMQVDEVSLNPLTGRVEAEQLVIYEADGATDFIRIPQLETRLSWLRLLTGVYCLDGLRIERMQVDVWQRDTLLSCSDFIDHLMAEDGGEPLPLVIQDIQLYQGNLHFRDLGVGSDFSVNDLTLDIPGIDLRELNTSVGIGLAFVDGGILQTQVRYNERARSYQLELNLTDFNLKSMLPYVRQQMLLGDMRGQLNLGLTIRGKLDHLLDFNVIGRASVHDLELLDPDDECLLRCDSVSVGVRSIDLVRNSYRFSEFYFDRPSVGITFGSDSLDNFTRLLVEAQEEVKSESTADTLATAATIILNNRQQPLQLLIDRISVRGGSLEYRDESLRAEPFVYHLSDIDVDAPNFDLDGRNRITAQASLGKQGKFALKYNGRIENLRNMHLEVKAQRVDVVDFSPYTVQMFGNELSGGILDLDIYLDTHEGELYSQNRLCLVDPKVEKKRRGVKPEMKIPFRTGLYILTDKDNVCDLELPVHGNIDEPRFSYKRLLFRTLGKFIVKICTSPFRRRSEEDTRSLDEIDLDHVSEELMKEE